MFSFKHFLACVYTWYAYMYICMFLYVGTGMCMTAHGVGGSAHNRTQSLPTLTSLPSCLALRSSSKCWNYSWLPHLLAFTRVLGLQTLILTLAQQALFLLSHPCSPSNPSFTYLYIDHH